MENQSDQARELLAQQRQHDALRQEAMLTRAESETSENQASESATSKIEEKARTAMASELHKQEQVHGAMLERTTEELDET